MSENESVDIIVASDAMTKLCWEILRNREEYQEDCKKYEENGGLQWFCEKWGLLHPIDPNLEYEEIETDYKPYYFFAGGFKRIVLITNITGVYIIYSLLILYPPAFILNKIYYLTRQTPDHNRPC